MTVHPSNALAIRNVAIATDFSPWSFRATQHALVIARQFGATLHFLHTVRRSEFSFVPELEVTVSLGKLAERDCNDLVNRLTTTHDLDDIEYYCWNMEGEISDVFGDFVRDHEIDLLILGTRGRNVVSKFLLGSIAEEIFHCVSCPVVTLGPRAPGAGRRVNLKKILLATDLSRGSLAAIPYVIAAAETWGAEVDVLHVCSSQNSSCQESLEAFGERLRVPQAHGERFTIRTHVRSGELSATVLDFARRGSEDLIVLGVDSHRSLYDAPSFSPAYEVMRRAACPVLSIHSASCIGQNARSS